MDSSSDLAGAKAIITALDLSAIIKRLIQIENWSQWEATMACEQYKNYLFLKKKYGHQYELPPSVDIDDVWHAHILHTEDYSHFCVKLFGYYLHHHPHHGKDNTWSDRDIDEMFEQQTCRLYYQEFSEHLYAVRSLSFKTKWIRWCNQLKQRSVVKQSSGYKENSLEQ